MGPAKDEPPLPGRYHDPLLRGLAVSINYYLASLSNEKRNPKMAANGRFPTAVADFRYEIIQ